MAAAINLTLTKMFPQPNSKVASSFYLTCYWNKQIEFNLFHTISFCPEFFKFAKSLMMTSIYIVRSVTSFAKNACFLGLKS